MRNIRQQWKVFAALGVLALVIPTFGAASDSVDELLHTALSLDAKPKKGAVTFKKHCAACHGTTGLGNAVNEIPSIAGQRQAYVIKQLADFSQGERDSKPMHRTLSRSALNDPQVWVNVAAYVNQLPVTRFPQRGSGKKVLLGEAIFREQCASCHEEDGRGDDDGFVPSLRNQHYSYLLKQMHGFANWHRRNVDEDLVRFLTSLDEEEVTSVTDYLSRFEGPIKDRTKLSKNGVAGD